MKKLISVILSAIMATSAFAVLPTTAFAAKSKVSLDKSSATLKIRTRKGKSVFGATVIKVKKAKGVKIKSLTFKSSSKKIATVSKKGKVTAKRKGSTKISVLVKYKLKKKNYSKALSFDVKVKDLRKSKKITPTLAPPPLPETEPETEPQTEPATETQPATDAPETTAPWEWESKPDATGEYEAPAPTGNPYDPDDIQGDTNHCENPDYSAPESYGQDDTCHDVIDWPPKPSTYGQDDTGHCCEQDMTIDYSAPNSYGYTDPSETEAESATAPAPTGEPTQEPTEAPTQAPTEKPTRNDNVDAQYIELNTIPSIPSYYFRNDEKEYLGKLSAFSNKLYALSAESEDENFTMSPISVYLALAILYNSGDNGVKQDIESLTGMTTADLAKTDKLFQALTRERRGSEDELISQLSLTNSIWIDENEQVNSDALNELAEKVYCAAFKTPFRDNNDAANKAIREFIKENTKGLIDQDFGIEPTTLFALINTLYFKDGWEHNELTTTNRDFTTAEGKKTCEFLKGEYIEGKVQETDSCYYFYTTTRFGYKAKFILPKDGFTLKQAMSSDNLQKINQNSKFGEVDPDGTEHFTRCIFPSFKIESDTPLTDIFKSNGLLKNAFSGFSSPLTETALQVSQIKHKAVIDVSKEGIEGAAVTIIEEAPTAMPIMNEQVFHDFVLEKAFGFIITTPDDIVLFEGQVINP